jgi:hypothetical protein
MDNVRIFVSCCFGLLCEDDDVVSGFQFFLSSELRERHVHTSVWKECKSMCKEIF